MEAGKGIHAPLLAGAIWTLATPAPDLLITGDGAHVAIRTEAGPLSARMSSHLPKRTIAQYGTTRNPWRIGTSFSAACGTAAASRFAESSASVSSLFKVATALDVRLTDLFGGY